MSNNVLFTSPHHESATTHSPLPPLSFETATMAELFVQQGKIERAIAIYREIYRRSPQDLHVKERLAALERQHCPHVEPQPLKPLGLKAMDLRVYTQTLVEAVPGALACVIMGFDGIPLDSFQIGGAELDAYELFVDYLAASQKLFKTAPDFDGSHNGFPAGELIITASEWVTLIRKISDNYFIGLVLNQDGLLGKARYLLRTQAPKIAMELL